MQEIKIIPLPKIIFLVLLLLFSLPTTTSFTPLSSLVPTRSHRRSSSLTENKSHPSSKKKPHQHNLSSYRPSSTSLFVKNPSIKIAYCTGCGWLHRASWFSTELLLTLNEKLDLINSVTLAPDNSMPGGKFLIELELDEENEKGVTNDDKSRTKTITIWDRKSMGGFPELKEVKSRIRDLIDVGGIEKKNLGHSERTPPSDRIVEVDFKGKGNVHPLFI